MLGFFNSIRHWVHGHIKLVSGLAAIINPALGAAIYAADAAGAFDTEEQGKIDASDLSPADAAIIVPWDDNHFLPWFTSIVYSLTNNVQNKALNISTRAQFANDIIIKIIAVQSYYASYDKTGLSADAIFNRLNYINITLNAVLDTIYNDTDLTNFGDTYGFVNVTKNFNSIDLSILAPPVANPDFTDTFQLYNVSTNVANLTPSATAIATNPIPSVANIKATINQLKDGDLAEVGTTTTAGNTNTVANTPASSVATTNTPTTSTNTTATDSSGSGLKVLGFIAISALLLKWGFGSSSKSSKNN